MSSDRSGVVTHDRTSIANSSYDGSLNGVRYVSIEGNIGAGKSSVVKALTEFFSKEQDGELGRINVVTRTEPLDDWIDILPDFYGDPSGNSLRLQMEILRSRMEQLHDLAASSNFRQNERPLTVIERCPESSSDVFVPCLLRDGLMTKGESESYKKWYALVQKMTSHELVGVIYIDASPSTCMERIKKRSREAETDVQMDYLTQLHDQYSVWLKDLKRSGVFVLRIDADLDGVDAVIQQVIDGILTLRNL
jgi:deoxyadenosine/deoxycytidine kinase